MQHRNPLFPTIEADRASAGINLIPLGQGRPNDDILQALLLTQRSETQGAVSSMQTRATPSQHPGQNIPSTGHRAIHAWRSGRRS